MSIDAYTGLITSEHKIRPNFMAWLSAALQKVDDGVQMINSIPSAFDIDQAVGPQLDIIGQILGRSRQLDFQPSDGSAPTLDDADYQIALKAKVLQNQWDGTIPSIYNMWNSLFSNITLNIVDNQDMTMSVIVNGQISTVINEMLAAGYIVPSPAGVTLTIIEPTNLSENLFVEGLVTTNEIITLTS